MTPSSEPDVTALLQRLGPFEPTSGGRWFRSIADETGWTEQRISTLAQSLGLWPGTLAAQRQITAERDQRRPPQDDWSETVRELMGGVEL